MMKKIIFFTLLSFVVNTLHAQQAITCQEGKMQRLQHKIKKSRASNYANSLMSQYDVHFYYLDLNIERNSTVISGSTMIGAKLISSNVDTFCFELNSNLVIDSVLYNNQVLNVSRVASISYAIFPTPLGINQDVYLKIFYHGDAALVGGSAIGDGFTTDTSPSWGNSVTWSLSEPYSAYEWFPCKQFLQDKADSAWVYVTTDNQNKVGSNGILQGVDSLANNKVRFRWKSNYIIDYYLISVAVAKYVDYTIYAHPASLPNDSIKIVNYVYNNPNTLPAFKEDIDSVALVLEYYSELFGLYPFYQEKYGHSMAPLGGGMEHQTMTTVGNLGNFSLNSHELMHQWFGDHVTCKTWKDIFINEGFASYGEYLAYEHFRSWNEAQLNMADVHDNVLMDPNAMVYFTDTTNVNRIFDSRLTYDKGSAVVHTLRFVLGDSLFFRGLKQFQTQYSFSTASIDDLKASMEASSGINLSDYFNQWLYGEGYPIYAGEFYSNGTTLFLKVSHTTSSALTSLFKTPLEIKCSGPNGDTTIKVEITQNANTFMIPMSKNITSLTIDPNNWILNKSQQFSINPDLISLQLSYLELQQSIEVYPNPSMDEVNIICSKDPQATFELKDIQGKILLQGQVGKINIKHLPSGIFIVNIRSKDGNVNRKIVKQ